MMDIVKAEPPLYAQAVVIGRTVAPFRVDDLLVLYLVCDLAADAAVGAQRIDFAIRIYDASLIRIKVRRGHQRSRRTRLHALPACHTGGAAHRIIEVKHHLRSVRAIRHADDIVHLNFTTRANAQVALDTGVEIDAHGRMARVRRPALGRREATSLHLHEVRLTPEVRGRIVRGCALRLVGHQELHHHGARLRGTLRGGLYLHAHRGRALT